MKKIEYLGTTFDVPDWANYLAQDWNGKVFAYDVKPFNYENGSAWKNKGQYLKVVVLGYSPNWRESLYELPPVAAPAAPIAPTVSLTDSQPVTAPAILDKAVQHMRDRAATYDTPEGERSMAKAVQVFNTVHGTQLTVAQGWDFLATLKHVRMFQNGYHADSVEDRAAYVALCGESQARGE